MEWLIPICVQDQTNSQVFWPSGFVAYSSQIAVDMRLMGVSPAGQNPARLSLILNAHRNNMMNRHGELNNPAREDRNGARDSNPQQATPFFRESINPRALHPRTFCMELLPIEPKSFK